jgi:hypothetical protein
MRLFFSTRQLSHIARRATGALVVLASMASLWGVALSTPASADRHGRRHPHYSHQRHHHYGHQRQRHGFCQIERRRVSDGFFWHVQRVRVCYR